MNWISRLESKFGHLAVQGLMWYVAAFTAFCFILVKLNPYYLEFLWLNPSAVIEGQVWRVFTFLFIPSIGGIFPDWLGTVLYLMYLVWIGNGLEQALGVFRTNLYFVLGMLSTIGAALVFGSAGLGGGGFFYMSLFLAFARFFPDEIIRIYFILPVKVRWLAWFDVAVLMFFFVVGTISVRAAILVSFLNYFIFFGREIIQEIRTHGEVRERRAKFQRAVAEGTAETLHRCHVCGVTETTSPHMEFRVSEDGEEYCREHLPKRSSPATS